jgi:hypothetical protein
MPFKLQENRFDHDSHNSEQSCHYIFLRKQTLGQFSEPKRVQSEADGIGVEVRNSEGTCDPTALASHEVTPIPSVPVRAPFQSLVVPDKDHIVPHFHHNRYSHHLLKDTDILRHAYRETFPYLRTRLFTSADSGIGRSPLPATPLDVQMERSPHILSNRRGRYFSPMDDQTNAI